MRRQEALGTAANNTQGAGPAASEILLRTAAGLLGGYAFVLGLVTLGIALGLMLGLPYDEVRTFFYLLAFLVFTAAFCWAFVVGSQQRAWLVLAGGGVGMTLAGWWLASHWA